ncbi:MAG: DUF5060 domain-containing protein [Firmicutes bacterium]|nr:DUF5060 domain-containing protein [Bacillota bacterium]
MRPLARWIGLVCPVVLVLSSLVTTGTAQTDQEIVLWQSFEGSHAWRAVGTAWKDGDSSLVAETVEEHATDGQKALRCRFRMTGSDFATFMTEDLRQWSNWSPYRALLVDVFNGTAEEVRVALAVCTGDSWEWHETRVETLVPGLNRDVSFPVEGSEWKTAASNWEFKSPLKNADQVKRVALKFFGRVGLEGEFYLDNLRLIKPRPAALMPAAAGPAILNLADNLIDGAVAAYEKLELRAVLAGRVENPYDPAEFEVEGLFTDPEGKTYRVPGFFYQPFTRKVEGSRELYTPAGEADWRVRFTPTRPGDWTYRLRVRQGAVEIASAAVPFKVQPGKRPGFVRVAPGTGYFVFESGEPFVPIGSNVAWYDARGMLAYEHWFKRMAENGANYARIWLASWGFAPEWLDTGLGNYHNRQRQAWQLDYLFELAEKHGIYIMLCLTNHGQFSRSTDAEWDRNPYNVANGGFLQEPAEFLTDPRAKELFRRKLRYIVARWGYSPNLFSWEWFNEVNLATGLADDAILVPWMEEMNAYLETLDPYDHLVSNSFSSSIRGDEPHWTTAAVDYLQFHQYNQYNWSAIWYEYLQDIRRASAKPVLIGEFGLQSGVLDPQGIHFHEGLWAGLFVGAAGTGMLWWWDTYIEPNDLYRHFKGVSSFFREERLPEGKLKPARLTTTNEDLQALGLVSENRALVWVRSLRYNHRYFENQAFKVGPNKVTFPKVTGEVEVPGLSSGKYMVERWDTLTGKVVSRAEVRHQGGKFVLSLPGFDKDLAFKIIARL